MADKPKRRRSFPITYLFPNVVTLGGLCAGLSAVRFAMAGRWEICAALLILAAIIDGMDGRLARMLNATSTFGAELDSLADFVSFGIAPVLVLYMWQLNEIRGMGWFVVMVYAVCCALRLARFNSRIFDESKQTETEKRLADEFFTGVPAPAGAMLCILPLVLSLEYGTGFFTEPKFVIGYVMAIGFLMVGTLPTISLKKFRISHQYAGPLLVFSGLWLAGMIIEPWFTFTLTCALYFAFIPLSLVRYHKMKRALESGEAEE